MTREEATDILEKEKRYYVLYLPAGEKLGKAEEWGKTIEAYNMAINALKEEPRKTAKWSEYGVFLFQCSNCCCYSMSTYRYCSHCGARMEGEA